MNSSYQTTAQPVIQREMPFFMKTEQSRFVDSETVEGWSSYREAVVWCWENRSKGKGMNDRNDQAMFARHSGAYTSHMSRFVSPVSKAPMDMHPDLIPSFEGYTGWRGITQYLAKRSGVTLMEEVIEQRRAA